MTTEPTTQRDYVSVGLTDDKTKVRVTLKNDYDGFHAAVNMDAATAIDIAGQIQFNAMLIKKP